MKKIEADTLQDNAPASSGRKKIAVFISALYENMVRETVDGLLSAARDENVKLIFFTSFADNYTRRLCSRA